VHCVDPLEEFMDGRYMPLSANVTDEALQAYIEQALAEKKSVLVAEGSLSSTEDDLEVDVTEDDTLDDIL